MSEQVKLCECGCGYPAPIAKKTCRQYGAVKGQPRPFISGHQNRKPREPFIGPLEPGTRMIPLTKGMFAKVDEADYEWLSQWPWHFANRYALRPEPGTKVGSHAAMHREIMQTPKGMDTDHINGDKLDNRRANLRVCTRQQNHRNLRSRPGSSSQFLGVTWDRRRKNWVAHISMSRKTHHLGAFTSEEEAARARDAKARELFGEFAYLNFPD